MEAVNNQACVCLIVRDSEGLGCWETRYQIIVFYSSMFISLSMTGRSQALQLLYYIIIVSSELQVQLESSTRFIEIYSILTILFNND